MANSVTQLTHSGAQIDDAIDAIGNKYEKPAGGIPKTDLTTAVQTSLGKADTALQSGDTITGLYTVGIVNKGGTATPIRTRGLEGGTTAGAAENLFINNNHNGNVYMCNGGGRVGIATTTPSEKLHVNGVVKCTSVDTSSDETIKNKVGDINIKVEDIAAAPNVTFTWKKGEDTKNIHGGTYAQYWEKITPYYVHGEEGDKSLDYASLAVSCSIELAKEVVALKEENAMLKQELEGIREMLKKLL